MHQCQVKMGCERISRSKIISFSWRILLINTGICTVILYMGICGPKHSIVRKDSKPRFPADSADGLAGALSQRHSRIPISKWEYFFAEIRKDLAGNASSELAIENFLFTASPKHELSFRFPLPSMPIVIETNTGVCLLGAHLTKGTICQNSLRGQSSWSPDPHVRDIISTAMLNCAEFS